ncbi:phosphoenolpyruvate-protein phosphotransferase [Elusimicrobium posterum]|uniref:phosphoenolpyruvate--protein phosphotransferase n=1 Tax=Elusimicrobium posterum TaxID=3116653 RepID=UPI003C75E3C3
MTLKVLAPADGVVVPVTEVPDPAFSEKMMGDGIAVKPSKGEIYAPVSGKVTSLHKSLHAVSFEARGVEILIHVGVETVALNGEGFKAFVKQGDIVKKGDKILEFDLEKVSKSVPSDLVIMIVTNPMDAVLTFAKTGNVKAGVDELFSVPAEGAEEEYEPFPADVTASVSKAQWLKSEEIEITNEHGFHARPAGTLAAHAAKFNSIIELEKGAQRVNVKSMVSVMGLGIEYKDKVVLYANGADAQEALTFLTQEIKNGLNEGKSAPPPLRMADRREAPVVKIDFSKQAIVGAQSASAGIVMGKVFMFKETALNIPEGYTSEAKEKEILSSAISTAKANIQKEIEGVQDKENHVEILNAHIGITEDPFLVQTAQELIKQGKNAAAAWSGAVAKSIEILAAAGTTLIKERIADYKDVERRVIKLITGQKDEPLNIPENSIVFAEEFLPYHLNLFNKNVAGVVSALGSPTAHVSIMLRNIGLPALVGAGKGVLEAPQGMEVILDAFEGTVTFNPEVQLKTYTKEHIEALTKSRAQNKEKAFEPAVTTDGVVIKIEGNVGSVSEGSEAAASGADGLGLVRTEFLFGRSHNIPTEEEQYNAYKQIMQAMKGKPVTIRTFDVGGDKPLAYMHIPREENPIVGLRGVRNYEKNMELFRNQVRALLRLEDQQNLRIMIPMISFVSEFEWCKQVFETEKAALGVNANYNLGMMIEVPSAAIGADKFAKRAAFFSIGTNDLTQYTLAIDRGHTELSKCASNINPSVLALIQNACKAAENEGKIAGVCGAMASELHAIPLLIGLGVRELAVTSAITADVKALIRNLSVEKCRAAAQKALSMDTSDEVRQLIKTEFSL